MGRMDPTMQMVAVMQEFGWTYQEYVETPAHILSLIMEKLKIDRKREELAAKRQHRGK